MKRMFTAAGILASLAISSVAMATPMTWTDRVANAVTLNSSENHTDYSFIYNIAGTGSPLNVLDDASNPFQPGPDKITSANLLLNFTYGTGGPAKKANILLDSGTQSITNFSIIDKDVEVEAGGIVQLNLDGTLTLDIHRISGTFELTDSILTANGEDNTPAQTSDAVPEPGTVALLGLGLAGLGLYTRRRRAA